MAPSTTTKLGTIEPFANKAPYPLTPFTQVVRSTPASISPLIVLKTVCESEDGLERTIRLLESGLRTYGLLSMRLRRRGQPRSSRKAGLFVALSCLALGRRFARLAGLLRASRAPDADENLLKRRLRATSDALELTVSLLDDLNWLVALFHCVPARVWAPTTAVASLCALLSAASQFAVSSIAKAELWHCGRRTRCLMLERERLITEAFRVGMPIRTAPTDALPVDWDRLTDEERLQAEYQIAKERKKVLRDCRRAINQIWWTRLGLICDGLSSSYDLLKTKCVSLGVRTALECISSFISFREAYVEALKTCTTKYLQLPSPSS